MRYVMRIMLVLWTSFPVVWLLAELQIISSTAEQLCWGICDYSAKVKGWVVVAYKKYRHVRR